MAYIQPEALINASRDAQDLEKFVNDTVPAMVQTRLGGQKPNFAKLAADAILDTGMYASEEAGRLAVADGTYYKVQGEGNVAAFEYRRESASISELITTYPSKAAVDGVESLADSLDAAVKEIDSRLYDAQQDSDSLLVLSDLAGNVAMRVRVDAGLEIPGLDGTVQEAIENLHQATSRDPSVGDDDILALLDDDENIVVRVDRAGGLHLPGITDTVQEILIAAKPVQTVDTTVAETRGYRDTFSTESLAIVSTRLASGMGAYAPIPFNLLPQNYTIGDTWIGQLTTTEPARTPIDSPYFQNDGVVHPYMIEFYNGFRGYRYWTCITPYRLNNEAYENPVIYGSNDLASFTMLDGFEQPLAPRPLPGDGQNGHLSDNAFAYSPMTGELICFWRQSIRLDGPGSTSLRTMDSLWYRATKDGFTWTEAAPLFPENPRSVEIMLSPSVLLDPVTGLWHMYSVSGNVIRHRTARDFRGPWSDYSVIAPPSGVQPWHLEVKYVGDKQVMLIHDNTVDNLYFGISSDWDNWTVSNAPVLTGPLSGVYKATFNPIFNDVGEMAMQIIWTSDQQPADPAERWALFVNTTNFVTV